MNLPIILADGESVAALAVGGGLVVAIVSIITTSLNRKHEVAQREQSRREIAAYVAEGTITPDQAERLLATGKRPKASSKTSA